MLDYTKLSFNEIDNDDIPVQVFYGYSLNKDQINTFLAEYATCEEVPEGVSVQAIEICLSVYTQGDYKLEACCTDTDIEQYWVTIAEQFSCADQFFQLIPDCERNKVCKM